jgi:hypothetical protein
MEGNEMDLFYQKKKMVDSNESYLLQSLALITSLRQHLILRISQMNLLLYSNLFYVWL